MSSGADDGTVGPASDGGPDCQCLSFCPTRQLRTSSSWPEPWSEPEGCAVPGNLSSAQFLRKAIGRLKIERTVNKIESRVRIRAKFMLYGN